MKILICVSLVETGSIVFPPESKWVGEVVFQNEFFCLLFCLLLELIHRCLLKYNVDVYESSLQSCFEISFGFCEILCILLSLDETLFGQSQNNWIDWFVREYGILKDENFLESRFITFEVSCIFKAAETVARTLPRD